MPTPHPPRPPYPPPGGEPEESDEGLAARLRGRPDGEAAQSVALLMARHWQPAHAYAVICLASPEETADMVTAAAFHQVFDRLGLGEQALALRPRILVAVRDTVREWSAQDRISGVLPDLVRPGGGRGMRAAKSMIPENRKLAERSFQSLPGLFRCLLWHTEVESEPISVPAALLGMDTDTASAALEQAREKFREGCVHAHRELAPTKDCRFYNRLLDVPIRRGGALLPDVQQHLKECRYCRSAAEQLSHFEGGLGILLAEAVLGWGARRYLEVRPRATQQGARVRGTARHGGGRRRILARIPTPGRRGPGGPRSSRTLLTGVGLASAGVIAAMLAAGLWSHDGGADPAASTGATGGGTSPGVDSQSPGTAQLPNAPGVTRLRNVAADLCLDIRGEAKAGAGTELAACSSARSQQWSYENDGLLRSVVDEDLCLDSHADAGVVILGSCVAEKSKRSDDVRYDLTVQGELLPRWDEQLALTSVTEDKGADIVVKVRDGSGQQRWQTDPVATAGPGSLSVTGSGSPGVRAVELSDRT
ncbi:ricin-type beta-trefoil lectin domain protein [Streptomyces fulvoviolaceus]|uniref:ricin-type beta-trefoil lectin domain protein n=1 Tax=Streptomyces fulvoviolaceus TaxID=285535 RepID=UPI0004CA2847|nr:ricin-type beta-trefoil lectin domain protein [Streptomyces fulvoviolaceus]